MFAWYLLSQRNNVIMCAICFEHIAPGRCLPSYFSFRFTNILTDGLPWWSSDYHQNTKIMAAGPITSWQIDGETMEKVTDFLFGGSKITADGDCAAMKLKDACSLEEKL